MRIGNCLILHPYTTRDHAELLKPVQVLTDITPNPTSKKARKKKQELLNRLAQSNMDKGL